MPDLMDYASSVLDTLSNVSMGTGKPLSSIYLKLGSFLASKTGETDTADGFNTKDENNEDVAVADLGTNDTPCIEFKDEDILKYIDDMSCTPQSRRTSPLSYQSRYYGNTNKLESYSHRREFNKYNLRIGDSCFYIPPSYINVSETSNTVREAGIRMSSSVKIKSAYSTVDISIELYFNGDEQINGFKVDSPFNNIPYYVDGLRPFIAQCKLSPIMPVENEFLNFKCGIYAIAIQGVTISTVPGFPKLLKVLVDAVECNHTIYTMTPDYMFSDLIDWDLYKYNYQRILTDLESSSINENLKLKEVTNFSYEHKMIISMISNISEMMNDNVEELFDLTKASYTPIVDNINNEFTVQQMNFGLSNIIINTQLSNHTKPAIQYLGGNDNVFTIQISTSNHDTVSVFKNLTARVKYMSQQLRESTGTGFLKIDNDLINILGVNYFLLESINIETVPNFPDLNLITLECVSYDNITALAEELNGFNPFPDDRNGEQSDTLTQDLTGLYSKISQDVLAEVKMCKGINLYPDLMLPTYAELDSAITSINNYRSSINIPKLPFNMFPRMSIKDYKLGSPFVYDLYVDPDYYFMYAYNTLSETINNIGDLVVDKGVIEQEVKNYMSKANYSEEVSSVIKEKLSDIILNKELVNKVTKHTYIYTLETVDSDFTFNLSGFFNGSNNTDSSNNSSSDTSATNSNIVANSATEAFLKVLTSKVGKAGYLYGATGQIMTTALANQMKSTHGSICRINNKWMGMEVYDCSGFVAYGMRETGYTEVPARTSHTGLLPYCTKISKSNLQPGDLLLSSGHIAVYTGDGKTVEAMGADYGVCEGTVKDKYNIFARINWPQSVVDKWKQSSVSSSTSNESKNSGVASNNSQTVFSLLSTYSDKTENDYSNKTKAVSQIVNDGNKASGSINVTIEKMLIKYNFSARKDSIKYIVIHDTANTGKGAGVKAHFNYFNEANRKASADYFVDDKMFGQFVEDTNKSLHCGDGGGKYGITNDNSIGIEICINSDGNYDKTVKNTIELTKYLMNKYSIPVDKVVRHYDASRKPCPGTMMPNDWKAWKEFKKSLSSSSTYNFNTTNSSSNGSTANTSTVQKTITLGKYGDNRDRHDDVITQACKKHGMSPNWFKALITQESTMNEKAGPNSCGAIGLLQITRDPCSELGVPYDISKLKEPAHNLDVGMRYLKKYKSQVNNNYLDLACLHNCGPGRFAQYQKGTKSLPSETIKHREKVQGYYTQLINSGGEEGEYNEDGSVTINNSTTTTTPSGEKTTNEYYITKTIHKVVKDHGKIVYTNLPSRTSGSGSPSYQMPYSISTYAPTSSVTSESGAKVDKEEISITVNTHSLPIGVPLTDFSPINTLIKTARDNALYAGMLTGMFAIKDYFSKSISSGTLLGIIAASDNALDTPPKTELDLSLENEDFLSDNSTSSSYSSALNKFKDRENRTYLSTMTIDDARYNARASMLRAFPTYCVVISDDNSNWYDGKKLWSNYYPYKSVVSINLFHEREQPVGTLKLSVTNLTNKLNKVPGKKYLQSTMLEDLKNNGGVVDGLVSGNLIPMNYFLYKNFGFILGSPSITDGMIDVKNSLVKQMKLQAGTRVHVRVGYGSNPMSLNVMFNGTIAEVSVGEILEMVAQSDGAELINNVVSLKENAKNSYYNDMGIEASSIISSMLTDRQSWTNIVNPKWGEANKYNIEHFGHFTGYELRQYREVEYDMCKNIYFGNYYKNFYCGGRADMTDEEMQDEETVKEGGGMGLSNLVKQSQATGEQIGASFFRVWFYKLANPNKVQAMLDVAKESYDSVRDLIDGTGSSEETIKMYVYNKTPWDVMQTVTSTLPEFICQPMYHQFDSRIYFGLPPWLCKYRYDLDKSGNIIEQAKSFQQVHLINYDDILDNRMRCSNKFFNTNVVSMYNRGGELKATPTLFSDRTIDWSKQKTKVINTNIVQDYFGPDALYETLGYEHGKVAAIGNGLSNLIDSYDKQYFDEIITLGKPGIKPCDLIFVNDNFAEIYGLANVRSVTHTFSPQTGFITNITPGLISYSKIEDTGCSNSHNSIANLYDLISNVLESKKSCIDKLNILSPYLYQANIDNNKEILDHCSNILKNPNYDIDKWIAELENITSKESTKKYLISQEIRTNHVKEMFKVNSSNYALRYLRSFVYRVPLYTKITDYLRYGNCIIARPLLYKNYPFISGIKGSENLIPGYSLNPYKPKDGDMDETRIEEFDEN